MVNRTSYTTTDNSNSNNNNNNNNNNSNNNNVNQQLGEFFAAYEQFLTDALLEHVTKVDPNLATHDTRKLVKSVSKQWGLVFGNNKLKFTSGHLYTLGEVLNHVHHKGMKLK